MSKITVSKTVSATPSAVWAHIGNPADLHAWHPGITESPQQGNKRRCTLDNGALIEEEILAHDDAAMRYRYTITASPLPIKDYVSEIRVEAAGDGAKVTWEGTFEAVAAPDEMNATINGVYEAGLAALQATFDA